MNQGAIVFYTALNNDPWYGDLACWGGYYHANNVRKIVIPGVASASAHASTHGWQFTPHFAISHKSYRTERFVIEPFEMLDWVACWEKGFQERGAGILNMGQKSRFCSLLRNELGVRFHETLNYSWGTVRFLEKSSYVSLSLLVK